ncbi:MAG: T9SS type A sorting domain-containing protein [Chitinophagales bacterium]
MKNFDFLSITPLNPLTNPSYGYNNGQIIEDTLITPLIGTYIVSAGLGTGCTQTDIFTITTSTPPPLNLNHLNGPVCAETQHLYDFPNDVNATYVWTPLDFPDSILSQTHELNVSRSGDYVVEKTKNGCTSKDTITVNFVDDNAPYEAALAPIGEGSFGYYTFEADLSSCICPTLNWTVFEKYNTQKIVTPENVNGGQYYVVYLESQVDYQVCLEVTGISCNLNTILRDSVCRTFRPDYTIVSVNNNLNSINWSIYPNPNEGNFIIDIKSLERAELDLHIIDVLGREVFTISSEGSVLEWKEAIKIDVPAGMYHIVLETDNGLAAKKIIVYK